MQSPQRTVTTVLMRFLSRLRFRTLFLVSAALFVADLFFPDTIPLVDELLLGLGTVLLSQLKKGPVELPPPPPPPAPPRAQPAPPPPRGLP